VSSRNVFRPSRTGVDLANLSERIDPQQLPAVLTKLPGKGVLTVSAFGRLAVDQVDKALEAARVTGVRAIEAKKLAAACCRQLQTACSVRRTPSR